MKRAPVWARAMCGGLAVGLIATAVPQVLGVGYEATDLALKEAIPLALLIALGVAKTAATAISLGSGFAGGVFSPSLVIGAMVGGAFGVIAGSVFPDLATSPGAYTIIGMGAVTSAVLGAPISTILIVFELTGDYGVTIAVMIASAVSSVVTQQVFGKSFFHWQLERRGIDIGRDRPAGLLKTMLVREVMNETVRPIHREMKLDEFRELLRLDPRQVFFVVDGDGRLCGSVGFDDIRDVASEVDEPINLSDIVGDIVRPAGDTVVPDDDRERALRLMTDTAAEQLPVIDGESTRRIVGVIHHMDVVIAHNRALIDARAVERGIE